MPGVPGSTDPHITGATLKRRNQYILFTFITSTVYMRNEVGLIYCIVRCYRCQLENVKSLLRAQTTQILDSMKV